MYIVHECSYLNFCQTQCTGGPSEPELTVVVRLEVRLHRVVPIGTVNVHIDLPCLVTVT